MDLLLLFELFALYQQLDRFKNVWPSYQCNLWLPTHVGSRLGRVEPSHVLVTVQVGRLSTLRCMQTTRFGRAKLRLIS